MKIHVTDSVRAAAEGLTAFNIAAVARWNREEAFGCRGNAEGRRDANRLHKQAEALMNVSRSMS